MGFVTKSIQLVDDNMSPTQHESPTIDKIINGTESLDDLDTSLVSSKVIKREIESITVKASDAIYVDASQGSDTTGDGTSHKPYQTIQKAIDEAVVNQTVVVKGSETIQENIVCKDDVNIYAPKTILELGGPSQNQLSLARGAFQFKKIIRTSGSNVMITATEALPSPGYSILILYEIRDEGTGITIQNGLNRPLDLHIKQVFVSNSNIFLLDTVNSVSHTHINFDDIYLSSNGCTGIRLENGGNVVGYIQHIKELGAGIGASTAFDIDDGEINVICPDARVTTIANISPNGSFRFSSQRFSGDVNNSGGKYSYITMGDDDNSMVLSTNLNISLDSDSITLPKQANNAGSFLSVGTNGLINYTTLAAPASEWTDETEGFTTLSSTAESTLYSVQVLEDVDAGSYQYQVHVTPGFWMTTVVRIRRNNASGPLLNTQTSSGSGTQVLSYSLPISAANGNTLVENETVVVTVEMSGASAGTTIGTDGFFTISRSGSLATTWNTISGDPMDNINLATLFNEKLDLTGGTMTGSIDFDTALKVGPTGNHNFTLRRNNVDIISLLSTGITVSRNILPNSNETLDLGSQTAKWNNIYTKNMIVDGDLAVNGTTTTINTATVEIEDNIILINKVDASQEPYTPLSTLKGGIEIYRGTLSNYQFIFDEADDSFKIGEVGDLQKVATREDTPTNGGYAIWNLSQNRFDTTTTISYGDLTGAPSIPTDVSDLTDTTSLFFSRDYGDLNNAPILATVATSGSYTDLSGIPTSFAPSSHDIDGGVHTGTLGITKGGTGLSSFTQGDMIYAGTADTLNTLTKSTAVNQYLKNSGTNNNPVWAPIDYDDISGTPPLPTIVAATVATTGEYADLLNIPTSFTPSSHALDSHSDVFINTGGPFDGQLLRYDNINKYWVNWTPTYTSNTGTVTSVSGGNGLTGTVTTSGSITLGGPSSITLDSTNSVGTSTHSHAFAPGGTAAQYIDGVGSLQTFPTTLAPSAHDIDGGVHTGTLSISKGGTGAGDAGGARTNLGLGTAAREDKQTSTTDDTAGRVLILGAFGLGQNFIPDSQVASLSTSRTGFYTSSDSALDRRIVMSRSTDRNAYIEISQHGGSILQIFAEHYNASTNTTLTGRQELYHTGNLRSNADNDNRYLQLTGGTLTGGLTINNTLSLTGNINQTGTGGQLDVNPYRMIRFGRITNNNDFAVDIHLGTSSSTVNHKFRGVGNSFVSGNNGNFGVGTTTPDEKLDVSGTVRTESTKITDGTNNKYEMIYNSTTESLDFNFIG